MPNALPHKETYCLQPYCSSIESFGELSIICIEGTVSHVILKRPTPSDFRVHEKFGGSHDRHPVTREIQEFAQTMMEATSSRTELAVRFDAVRGPKGELQLLEMDLFGPCLYFCHAPEAADRVAQGILSRAKNQTS